MLGVPIGVAIEALIAGIVIAVAIVLGGRYEYSEYEYKEGEWKFAWKVRETGKLASCPNPVEELMTKLLKGDEDED